MKTNSECERARVQAMAWRDGETQSSDSSSVEHLSRCDACRHWQQQMEVLEQRLGTATYATAPVDLWTPIESGIREAGKQALPVEKLWAIGAVVLSLRALQLFVDLPLPWLHPIVAAAVAGLVVWRVGSEFVAIETFAPELQKRGL